LPAIPYGPPSVGHHVAIFDQEGFPMRKFLLPVLVVVLVLAGCGGDDDDGGGEASSDAPVQLEGEVENKGTAEATGDTADLEVEIDDNYFEPTFIKGTPGGTVTVTLHNEGSRPHTFTVDSLGIDEEVSGGDEVEVEVTLPDSGATPFYCRFHRDGGMQGAFFFEEGDSAGAGEDSGSGSGTSTESDDDGGLDY
jgi:plastocyanin